MGLRIDVGIDPDRDVGGASLAGRNRGEELEFRFRFDVDAKDAGIDRGGELGAVFPTPENMIRSGATPAASARLSSPPETTSAPEPSRAKVAITAWLELAFMA
jgi:hypothetical protein